MVQQLVGTTQQTKGCCFCPVVLTHEGESRVCILSCQEDLTDAASCPA